MRLTLPLAAALLLAPIAGARPSAAQTMPPMAGMPAPAPGEAPSTAAFRQAMEIMRKNMDIEYTGDADRDFVAGMIPNHQGAIDLARVELKFGNDPELRRLARQIITAQQKEIAFMRRWQVKHGEKHAG